MCGRRAGGKRECKRFPDEIETSGGMGRLRLTSIVARVKVCCQNPSSVIGLIVDEDRFLSPDEVDLLLNFTISSESFWDVLISTRDEEFRAEVRNLFHDDPRVRIRNVDNGCDTIISCARGIPNLLVIDDGISDISPVDIIRCLRCDQALAPIIILSRIQGHRNDGLPDWGADDYICGDDDVDKIYLSRKMHTLLFASHGQSQSDQSESHERRWPRTKMNITAHLTVSRSDDPIRMEQGEATVENISLGGAYLSDIRLESGVFPCGTFKLTLHVDQPDLRNWYADSLVVHQEPEGAAGVRFVNISRDDRLKIAELFCE